MKRNAKEINFEDLFKEAFLITWRNRFLWVFGFYIFLGFITSGINTDSSTISELLTKFSFTSSALAKYPGIADAFSLGLVIILVVFFLVRIIATAALIKSVANLPVYRQMKSSKIFNESKLYLRQLLLMEMLLMLVSFIISIVILLPGTYLLNAGESGLATIVFVMAFLILIPLAILAYYLQKFATIYIVLGKIPIKMSLEKAYILFNKNLKHSLKMGLMTVMLDFVMLLITAGIIGLFAAAGFVLFLLNTKTLLVAFSIFFIAIGLIAVSLLFSWYAAFLQTVWVLFFEHLALDEKKEKDEEEKLEVEGKVPSPEAV